jgi:hypothetical protein
LVITAVLAAIFPVVFVVLFCLPPSARSGFSANDGNVVKTNKALRSSAREEEGM